MTAKIAVTALVAAAALAAAAGAGATGVDQSVIPYQPGDPQTNGCPSGWEALSVDDLLGLGYQAPATVNANGDRLICGKPWTTAEQTARIPNAHVPVIFDFRDNDLPPYSA
jgi:hypothetical protein